MALTRQQSLKKLRSGARRILRAVKRYEEAPRGLLDLCACADLSQGREDIDAGHDALSGADRKGVRRAMHRDRKNGTAGSIVKVRRP